MTDMTDSPATRSAPLTYQDPYDHRQARRGLDSMCVDLCASYIGTLVDPTQPHRILVLFTDNDSPIVYVMTLLAGIWTRVS